MAHENRGKWPSSAPAIVQQALVERHATRDLLEDLGLVAGELGGAALIGDVVADRLVLDDLARRRRRNARSVHWYQRSEPSSDTSRSTCVRTESPAENDCRRSSICAAFRRGPEVDEPDAAQRVVVAAEELAERAVRERQRRVGPVAAHELGLVVDDAAVPRLALAQPALARAQRLLGLLALGDVARRDDDAVDRRVVEQVVGDDLGVHPRAVAPLQADLQRPELARRRQRPDPQLDDAVAVVGVHEVEDALLVGPLARVVAVHLLARGAGVHQLAVGADRPRRRRRCSR